MQMFGANGATIPASGLVTSELRGRTARIVEQAIKLGHRHIDTAQAYENEREVGEGLHASGIKRDELFLTTKVWTTHFAPHDLERSAKESLARHVGVSNFTVALIEQAVAASEVRLVCYQVEYHPYLDQAKVREACARHGLAVVAYSPIAKGKIRSDETLTRIGQAHGKTAAQVCLRWLVQQGVAAIPRTSRVERLSENIDLFDFALSAEEMNEIFQMGSAGQRMTDFALAPKWD